MTRLYVERDKRKNKLIWSCYEENIMTIQIKGISKEQFAKRIQTTLESFSGSPIVKRKQSVINKAMVQLLHGGIGEGRNEHNLDSFFDESCSEKEAWEVVESYYINDENSFNIYHEQNKYSANSEEEALLILYREVIEQFSNYLASCSDFESFVEELERFDSFNDFLNNFYEEFQVDNYRTFNEAMIFEFFEMLKNSVMELRAYTFNWIINRSDILGTYYIEKKEQVVKEVSVEKESKKEITIYTSVYKIHENDSENDSISYVQIYNDISLEEHNKRLTELFFSSINDDSIVDEMVDSDIAQELIANDENDIEEEYLRTLSASEIWDIFVKNNYEPNIIIEMLPEISCNQYSIETEYKQFFI